MIETMEKKTELLPIPFEEMEDWPVRMQEFFDLIARRPFELLERTPRLFGRELESWLRPDTELIHLLPVKLFETDEALVLRAEVPGFTEKELNVTVEPWRVIITGKKEFKEEKEYKELKEEKKELTPYLREKFMRQIYRRIVLSSGNTLFCILESSSAVDATEQIIRESVDMVLLDIRMPGVDGRKLYEVIRRYNPNIKVIVSSVYPIEHQKKLIPEADGYYDKSEGALSLLEKITNTFVFSQ